jgi:transcriptional regulator with XRE-family HTH domain
MAERRRRNARLALYGQAAFVELRCRVAENVRALREARGWTQAQAAEQAELGLRVWQAVEGGETNTTMMTISRVASGLEVDVTEIFARRAVSNPGPRKRGRPRGS